MEKTSVGVLFRKHLQPAASITETRFGTTTASCRCQPKAVDGFFVGAACMDNVDPICHIPPICGVGLLRLCTINTDVRTT